METNGLNSTYLSAEQKLAVTAHRQQSIARTVLAWEEYCRAQDCSDAEVEQGVEQINQMSDSRLKKLRKSLLSAAKISSLIKIDERADDTINDDSTKTQDAKTSEAADLDATSEQALHTAENNQEADTQSSPEAHEHIPATEAIDQMATTPEDTDQSKQELPQQNEITYTKTELDCIEYLKAHADVLLPASEFVTILRGPNQLSESALKNRRISFIKKLKADPELSQHFSIIGKTRGTKYLWKSDPLGNNINAPDEESYPSNQNETEIKEEDNFQTVTDWGLQIKRSRDGGLPSFIVNGHQVEIPENSSLVLESLINYPEGSAKVHELFHEIKKVRSNFKYEKVESSLAFIQNVLKSYGHQDKLIRDLIGPFSDRKYHLLGLTSENPNTEIGATDFLVKKVSSQKTPAV